MTFAYVTVLAVRSRNIQIKALINKYEMVYKVINYKSVN